jgi:DNA-binding NtrC family response regulator
VASKQPSTPDPPPSSARQFRWQALFQRITQPLFVLDRKRRILFVNRAWEELTGVESSEARGLACTRRGADAVERRGVVARALWPPQEVLQGKTARARRRPAAPTTGWWDIEFLPLNGPDGLLCILGRITGMPLSEQPGHIPFPEALRKLRDQLAKGMPADKVPELWTAEQIVDLRERHARRFRPAHLESPLASMRRVVDQTGLAAGMKRGVYLAGESGVGKSWLARAIHQSSPVCESAFVRLDCARLPSLAIADTLFGGVGLLRRPGIGTIYLKEPGRLPHDLQSRLHDWLEQNSPETTKSGPNIVAGSVVSPFAEVCAGKLLEKLYATLAVLLIELPTLRERMADLPDLTDRFLERQNTVNEHQIAGLTPAAWELIREYSWPGNLRELFNMLAAACRRSRGDRIDVADLPSHIRQAVRMEGTATPPDRPMPLDSILEQVERRLIELAMQRSRGNKSRAAELLGVWRPRLLRRMEALGMEQEPAVKSQESGARSQESEVRDQGPEKSADP